MNARTLPDPAAMAPAQLARALAAADAESSAVCSKFIATGRGHERPSDTLALIRAGASDPLTLRWHVSAQRMAALRGEYERRMTYHGSLRRIPAPEGAR